MSLPCQKERAKFFPQQKLSPIWKGHCPFPCWVLDCLLGLTPASPEGFTELLMAVDPFTKWVEVWTIQSVSSHEVVWLLHTKIVCQYGNPQMVQTDGGVEFCGAFVDYCAAYGIRHHRVTPHHPQVAG